MHSKGLRRGVGAWSALFLLVSAGVAAQVASGGSWQLMSRPLSASVVSTVIVRNGTLELLLLWRGAPGWFFNAGTKRETSGGRREYITGSLEYGEIRLDFSYDGGSHVAHVQGKEVSLTNGDNVILVDGIGDTSSQNSTRTASAAKRVESAKSSLGPIISLVPEIVDFLRCDVGMPDFGLAHEISDRAFNALFVCNELKVSVGSK